MTAAAALEVRLDSEEFDALRRIIHERSGISLADSKRSLVESRLARRLRARRLGSFSEYIDLFRRAGEEDEMVEMLNCITTNKTSFFREPHHFDFLTSTFLAEMQDKARQTGQRRLRIWSAGCSTGQEPYSIAIALKQAMPQMASWDIRILASDIDTTVLAKAERGVYSAAELEGLPPGARERAFSATKDGYQIDPSLRALITFRRINFVEEVWPIRTEFDVVFCRNVVIYFNSETQRRLYERIANLLSPSGYLVAGHSENLHWLSDLFTPVGKTVYRRMQAGEASGTFPKLGPAAPAPRALPARASPPRVAAAASALAVRAPESVVVHTTDPAKSGNPMAHVTIHAGGVHAAAKPTRIRTVLGSCVAACLYDPSTQTGGMNHFMLPHGSDTDMPTRYGIHAMEVLINGLLKLGAQRKNLVAKIFGGSNVIQNLGGENGVAQRNAAFVEEFLADEGIPVVAEKIGGNVGLVVEFETATGRAFVRAIDSALAKQVAREEERDAEKKSAETPTAGVTFF